MDKIWNYIFWVFIIIQYIGIGYIVEKMMEIVNNFKEVGNCLLVIENLIFVNIYKIFDIQFDNWQWMVVYNEDVFVKVFCFMDVLEQFILD